jgi:DNA-binding IclR family transcriptional regulator
VAPDAAAPGGPDTPPGAVVRIAPPVPGVPGAHLVWQQLTGAQDPVGHEQVATATGLPDGTVLRVLCALGRAGYVLRIPGKNARDPRQDLWLLAGGVREGRGVADQSAPAPARTWQHADTPRQAPVGESERGGLLEPFRPGALVTWRARAVWGALAADEAFDEVEVAQRAGVTPGTARIVLDRLLHSGAVTCTVTASGARWQRCPGYRTAAASPDRSREQAASAQPESDQSGEVVRFGPVTGNRRLAKGELQQMVLTALQDHYPAEFGPTGLATLLGGYSNGAVTNALTRLAAQHRIVLTCQVPKRYAALPPHARETPDTGC